MEDQRVSNDSRLSRMLHVLLHMARHEGPMTSEAIFWGVDGSLMASPPPSTTAGLGIAWNTIR